MGPIDYSSAFGDGSSPLQAFNQALQGGAMIRQTMLAQQQQQAQLQQQQQLQADMQALAKNPTPEAVARMATVYPQLSEQFKRSYDMLNGEQQQAKLSAVIPVYAAIRAGRPDIAAGKLRDTATAMENSGNADEAARTRAMADLIEQHPETGATTAGLLLASVMGPEKFATTFQTIGTEGRAADEAPAKLRTATAEAAIKEADAAVAPTAARQKLEEGVWKIADTKSQIQDRAARLGLDRDKLETETKLKLQELGQKLGELPEFVAKDISSATTDSLAAQASSQRMTALADQIDKASADLGGGVTAKAGELWKKTFGSQNDLTRIRAEYSRIVTPAAMAAYKQVASGSTSDKDIDTAMTGVPKDTDSPERMASFLRGAAKLQVYDSVLNNAKAEWLGAVRNLGKAKTDIEVDGVRVPAGTTFKQFADEYLKRKVEEVSAKQATQVVKDRSYMRFANPAAAGAPQPGALGSGTFQIGQ